MDRELNGNYEGYYKHVRPASHVFTREDSSPIASRGPLGTASDYSLSLPFIIASLGRIFDTVFSYSKLLNGDWEEDGKKPGDETPSLKKHKRLGSLTYGNGLPG